MAAELAEQSPLILNVDDCEAGRYVITRVLERASFRVREAASGAEALQAVAAEPPDLVLLDVNLPDLNGFEVCRRMKSNPATARIPVVHVSASSLLGSDQARGLEGGAESYLTEPVEPELLVATVKAALRARKAEEATRALARQWQTTFDAIRDGIALVDGEGRILRWNRSLERLLALTPDQLQGHFCYQLWRPEEEPAERLALLRSLETKRREEMDLQHGGRWFHVTVDPVLDADTGAVSGAVYIVADSTERKRLEEQFRQAQKFESIGHLAGGVAHDFNNLLTSILGNTSLVIGDLPAQGHLRRRLEEVMKAGQRAADLTKQLLAYSGKGHFVLKQLDLSGLITQIRDFLRSSVPRTIDFNLDLADALPPVEADPEQVQQVVLNLVMNSAEAIGESGGTIRVATSTITVPDGADLPAGKYAVLEVRDTGHGMDESVKSHIFDPFFTTRFTGRGLGLSAVSGIVRGHKGHIQVESAPGQGTCFRVLFPATAAATPQPEPYRTLAGPHTILVVDDEEMVRRVAKAALETRGYSVLLAENGLEALEAVRRHGSRISLVLLDLTMPVMSGREAIEEISVVAPTLRVIASSGYDQRETARRFGHRRLAGFIQKPYTAKQLADKVRAVLELTCTG